MTGEHAPDARTVAEARRQAALITRGLSRVVSDAELEKKLVRSISTGAPLRVKLGVDPTSTYLHLGFTVGLNKLRVFQDLGHQAVLIIGTATATVGDPTGRNKARPRLTEADVDRYAAGYLEQVSKILDVPRLEVRRNGDWISRLGFQGVVELAAKATVARMLERDDFSERFKAGTPIFLHELLYPLLQGLDSVEIRADVEIGGNDQLFNLLVGRDLQADAGQEPQVCLTTPLLVGLDGVQKMSKSFGNFVGVAEPAEDMFGKVMSLPDALMRDWFTLTTMLDPAEVEARLGGHPRDAKEALASAIVGRYHGPAAAAAAAAEFRRVFTEKQTPTEMPEVSVAGVSEGAGGFWVIDLIMAAGFAKSRSEARRLADQGAVSVSGARVADGTAAVRVAGGEVLQVGKRQFARLRR